MKPEFRNELGTMLPDALVFPHFPEREAAWLLHRQLDGPARIAELRRGPTAGLLNRPGVRDVLSACGNGYVAPHHLLPLANPLFAFGRERELMIDRASEAAFDVAAAADWQSYSVSFTGWADRARRAAWRELQLSRPGGNLVLQLNFPESYRAKFEELFGTKAREEIEYYGHPVRCDGPITMAWARLDLDPWGEDVLIEELQTDWLRFLQDNRSEMLSRCSPYLSAARRKFLDQSHEVFHKGWARALMLAVLAFADRELGASRVWLHRPETGAKLKNIRGCLPPRSLYTDLPRRFGFRETDRAPEFLYRARSQVLARLRRSGGALFWVMDLERSEEPIPRALS